MTEPPSTRHQAEASPRQVHLYAIGVGCNRPHGRYGRPRQVVGAAIAQLEREFELFAASPIILNPASGGAGRDFANAAVLINSDAPPACLLRRLKAMEAGFGRRRGRRWGTRVLDLDILFWSGGALRTRHLVIPHPRLEERGFVLRPLLAIAPALRLRGPLTTRHLAHRLARRAARG